MNMVAEFDIHFETGRRSRKTIQEGTPPPEAAVMPGNVPRLSRLMALAIKFDRLLREGAVKDYADVARLGGVSRARVTQIMNLLLLAPDIQEEILFLPRTVHGHDPIAEPHVRHILTVPDWGKQRRLWRDLKENKRISED
jgi:hypothetical protein